MDIQFKKLIPELVDDFIRYFDEDAFSDHDDWKGCYCLESHLPWEENQKDIVDERITNIDKRREKARKLVLDGTMTGYLLYEGDRVIAWCNAGDKTGYRPVCEAEDLFGTDTPEKGKVKILYCIDIAPDYRGKGIANLIMERFLEDAKKEGYSYAEGYPFAEKENIVYQYKGPVRLYEKYGFERYADKDWFWIMRKAL